MKGILLIDFLEGNCVSLCNVYRPQIQDIFTFHVFLSAELAVFNSTVIHGEFFCS